MMPGKSSRSCRDALIAFQSKDFAHWRGLPRHCDLSELLRLWPAADSGAMLGPLGRECNSTSYRYCAVPGYGQPVRVWYVDRLVVQIDVDDPLPDQPATTLLTQLGNPDARLDARYGYASLAQGEWFYGLRGLSLLCLQEEDRIEALSAFMPTRLEDYQEHMRVDRSAHPTTRGDR